VHVLCLQNMRWAAVVMEVRDTMCIYINMLLYKYNYIYGSVSRYLDTYVYINIHVLCLRNMRWAAVVIEVG